MNPMASSLLDDDQLSPTSPDSGAFAAAPAPATTLEVSRSLPSFRVVYRRAEHPSLFLPLCLPLDKRAGVRLCAACALLT